MSPMPPLLWILFYSLFFGFAGASVKFAAAHFAPLEMVFYRSVVGCLLMLAVAALGRRSLRTRNFRAHCWRGLAGFVALVLFFFALPRLPLSSASALLHSSPLFFSVFAVIFFGDRFSLPLAAALAASAVGMLLVLRPEIGGDNTAAALAALAAGAMAGFAYLNIRRLGMLKESIVSMVFYFCAISTALSAAAMAVGGEWSPMSAEGAGWLLSVGVFATAGQYALARGLGGGHSFAASSLMYSGVVFAGFLDYLLWDSGPDALSWAGIVMICGGGIGALWAHWRAPSGRPQP